MQTGKHFPGFFYLRELKENTMAQAKQGDTVQLHYMGKLQDGTVFDSSRERHPLQFTIGKGQVIVGFEQAVIGMKIGDLKTARIPMEQAYGPHRDDMVVTMDRSKLPAGVNPKIGQRLEITQVDDQTSLVTVTEVTESTLTLDANHPLAGKELTFDIELVGIVEGSN
jgi:FKBP-type peptidyl-prolyl cis-trans isomerase 2